jgi:hypothetical protein
MYVHILVISININPSYNINLVYAYVLVQIALFLKNKIPKNDLIFWLSIFTRHNFRITKLYFTLWACDIKIDV